MSEEMELRVARIIDPDAWHDKLRDDGLGMYWIDRRVKAKAKARDAIQSIRDDPETMKVLAEMAALSRYPDNVQGEK